MTTRRLLAGGLLSILCLFSVQASENAVSPNPQRVGVLIELQEPAATVVYAREMERRRPPKGTSRKRETALVEQAKRAAADAARQQIRRNADAQAAVRPRVMAAASSAVPMFEVQKVLNAIAIEVPFGEIDNLRTIPGVRRVSIMEPEYPTSSTSVPYLGTPALWEDSIGRGIDADGSGISIGVIDTGIDYQHGHFGGTGVLADYQANVRTVAPDSYFPTPKVVGGYDFAGDAYNGTSATIAPDPDPMDCNGHGTHVAGIAAGFGVNGDGTTFAGPYTAAAPFSSMRIGPGTAPRASLYALRVFGCTGGSLLAIQGIEWAVDPNGDSDLSDHLDVINMSLGSNFGSLSATSAVAADNAAAIGIIVVASAGNAGDTYYISGSPGSGQRVIATAGTQDPGLPGTALRVNTPAGIAGFYTVATAAAFGGVAPAGGLTGNVVIGLDPSDGAGVLTTDGCSPLTNAAAIAGNIALIDRGTCGFAVKAKMAQDAGATGVIIANSAAGAFGTMGGTDPTVTIPSVMVTFADGNTLKANIATLNVTLFNAADTIYTSSSRGPRGLSFGLKPDIAAPGLSITSAQTGVTGPATYLADSQPLTISGTSMSAPHMAGIMALLRQLHPEWSVEELKAAAMNGARPNVTVFAGGGGNRFDPGRVGAGRVDAVAAATTDVVAFNDEESGAVSLSFDMMAAAAGETQLRTLRIVNRTASAVTYTLGFDIVSDAPGVSFSLPGGNSIVVPAAGSVTLDVQASADPALMDHSRAPSVSATQTTPASPPSVASLGALNRHWLTEESGWLTLSQGANVKLRVPVYAAASPGSAMSAGAIVTGGNPTGSTTISLSGVGVCTGTLGAGPTCSGSFPTDEVSLVTPFELQVISPPEPLDAPAFADLQYAGVAYSSASDQLMFGVSMWGKWASPTDVSTNVYIDCGVYTNVGASAATDTCNGVPDGIWDLVLFNTNPGALSTLFGVTSASQDSFLTAVFYPTRSSITFGPVNYVNRLSAGAADTRLFDNNVMFLAADRARLKINAATGAFRYSIITCPGNAPLCLALNGFRLDQEAGPYSWNYLTANQGLDFGGGNLFFDLNGASLPVTWNTANLTANGSHGALLLHHHNDAAAAEVVLLDSPVTAADLSVGISSLPVNPAAGTNVTFTLTVTNNGPAAASGVVVSAPLPAGLTWVSDTGYDESIGTWAVGALASAGSASITITAIVETSDPTTFTAVAGGTNPDPDLANNTSSVTIQAPRSADVQLTMAASSPSVTTGNPVTFTITARNDGRDAAYSVSITEAFPAFPALNPSSFTASQGSYNPATGVWNLAGLPSGGVATLGITVNTPAMAGAFTSNASSTASTSDPNTSNNLASASVTVLSPANLSGALTRVTTGVAGSAVTYTLTLSNAALTAQQNNPGNEFTITLPSQVTLTSASASSGTAVATPATNTVTWNGIVPGSGSVTVTINATIGGAVPGGTPVSAQGAISFDLDGEGTNESAAMTNPASFTVLAPVVLSTVSKTMTGSRFPGGTVVYTITLQNTSPHGQLDLPGAEMTDVLPSSLDLVSASATSGTALANTATNTVTWNGAIPGNSTVTITVNATIDTTVSIGSSIANQAAVSYDADGNGTNEASAVSNDPGSAAAGDATAFNVVSPGVIGAPVKTVTGEPVAGTEIVYEVTFTNSGPSTQLDNPGDEFQDVLPADLLLVSASATSGTVTVDVPTNTVTWNGALAASQSVTVTIRARIIAHDTTITNVATVNFDADGNGTNESSVASNPAVLVVAAVEPIPTASETALMLLAAALAAAAVFAIRK